MPRDGRAARARAARRPIVIAKPMSSPANLRPYRRQWPRLGANVYLDAAALVVGEV
jgi:hypothetical protein